jgi:hypothetical protein
VPAAADETAADETAAAAAGAEREDAEAGDSQAQALASLKELCDCGLLPVDLYQENVAAIHRSSQRMQQWRERLCDKSQRLVERHAAMQVRQALCRWPARRPGPGAPGLTLCLLAARAGPRGAAARRLEGHAGGRRSCEAAGPAADERPAKGDRRQRAGGQDACADALLVSVDRLTAKRCAMCGVRCVQALLADLQDNRLEQIQEAERCVERTLMPRLREDTLWRPPWWSV